MASKARSMEFVVTKMKMAVLHLLAVFIMVTDRLKNVELKERKNANKDTKSERLPILKI